MKRKQDLKSLLQLVFWYLLALSVLISISLILGPVIPQEFEIFDFISELSVLTFALLWLLLLRQVFDEFDRLVVIIGICLFALGAFADILDEFGIRRNWRSLIENLSFVSGFLLVSLGLRDWIKNNYIKYQEALNKNEYLAFHDVLTGLNNRESLLYALDVMIGRDVDESGKFALIFIDLDRFKTINDTLGHQAGDSLLKEVASRIISVLRTSDHCFRIGGDEYVILIKDLIKEEDAYLICKKIREVITQPFEIERNKILTDGSFGIVLYPRDGTDIENLMSNADLAMYAAKNRNEHIRFFSEDLSRMANTKAEVEADLRSAMANNELYMNYQPIVSNSGLPVAIEALVRWDHPVKGKIPPESFISIAEDTGLIIPLGKMILKQSLDDYKNFFSEFENGLAVAVNISVLQLRDKHFVSTVLSILTETGVAPENLILEITESVIMDEIESFSEQMAPLLNVGIRFAIDDFGSGYSSLNYLQKLPVEIVKFDRDLLNGSANTKYDVRVLHGLVEITRNLGKMVIVEGIESVSQANIFSDNNNILFQGYYFSYPNKKEQVKSWIEKSSSVAKCV